MARLIDADALRYMTVAECSGHSIEYAMGWKACVDWIKTLPTVGGWISVKDRLPEIDERVLVFGVGKYDCFIGTTQIAITHMSDRNLINCHIKTQPYWIAPWQYFLTDYEITHWMPLPEPPKEDDDAE